MKRLDDLSRTLTAPVLPMNPEMPEADEDQDTGKFFKGPALIGRLLFGAIFIAASLDKILHPAAFAQVIYNYQILPDTMINLTAVLLPWIELVLGLLIIPGLWLSGALVTANALLVAFSSALVFNLARGLDVHCGCFSTSTTTQASVWLYVLRDIGFLALGGYLLQKTFR